MFIVFLIILFLLLYFLSEMLTDKAHQKELNEREQILENQKRGLWIIDYIAAVNNILPLRRSAPRPHPQAKN